ncbi:endonuclease/exonuclease/phosphatase family protein [uncultured Kriegella sp.]|uniref:endonuclease/exonuclease/phosphatase family protein n=1 Tax=uncultured Kriegella sp. TaxID=1798910 RepID=UPI0030DD5940|tara:strand:+ start:94513 stop:95421 length:909 start_codon:yes stop_codon:yes gene_type:complete
MINKIKPFVLSILAIGVFSNGLRSQENLKVMSYNIWNGFDWGKDTDRKSEFIDWVNTQNPNVLALQELCGYTQEKLLADAKRWGHNYAEILKTSGYSVGITSKEPIAVKEKILDDMHHGALHCKVYDIDLFIIHFSPFSHQKRREEAKIIQDKLSELSTRQNKYLVLGDFNALSPFDAHLYKNNPMLLENKRASEIEHEHVRNLLDGELEYGVLGSFLGYPLIDVVQRFTSSWDDRVSCPTQVFESEKGEGRPMNSTRIDYILSSPFLATKCVKALVLNKKETFYLSDHYPVMAEFEFTSFD